MTLKGEANTTQANAFVYRTRKQISPGEGRILNPASINSLGGLNSRRYPTQPSRPVLQTG